MYVKLHNREAKCEGILWFRKLTQVFLSLPGDPEQDSVDRLGAGAYLSYLQHSQGRVVFHIAFHVIRLLKKTSLCTMYTHKVVKVYLINAWFHVSAC